jgi:hypothetical protein
MSSHEASAFGAAVQALEHASDAIIHAIEHRVPSIEGVSELAGIVMVSVQLYHALDAARDGDWDRFGSSSIAMSNAALSAIPFTHGLHGLILSYMDSAAAVGRASGGHGITVHDATDASLKAITDEIASIAFQLLQHSDDIPDVTGVSDGARETESVTHVYELIDLQNILKHEPAIVFPETLITLTDHPSGLRDVANIPAGDGSAPYHGFVPTHDSHFLYDFGHSHLPAELSGVRDAQNLHFWLNGTGDGDGLVSLQGGHHYAFDVGHCHAVDVSLHDVPLPNHIDIDLPNSQFGGDDLSYSGSDTPMSDTPSLF